MKALALLLGAWCILECSQNVLSQTTAPFPRVFLRTRTIDTAEEALKQQRRRLLGEAAASPPSHPHHTASDQWGGLRGTHQWLLTHAPGLAAQQQAELVAAVEAAGGHVAHYLPDHTLLVVGPARAASALEQHPHALWLGPHGEQDKLAPEWAPLLQQLRQLRPQIERAAALAAAANGTAAAAASARAVQDALPAAAEWDAERGQLLVGAVVTFPGLAGPASRRIPAASTQQAQRARRIMLERRRRDAGAAAAADWAPHLCSLGGARVRRAAADSLLVLAPAERLQQVLSWLAQRPATHWVAPAPKVQLNNIRASTITQSGRATAAGSSGIDPAFHPVWAAGITGQGQVVGCGDSGVDRFHCFFSDSAFASADAWQAAVRIQDGVRTFDSPDHRKIRYLRAFGDSEDSNGHGTHVVGTLVGLPEGTTLEAETPDGYVGMAPDAKVAFIDLADSSSDKIFTPSDLIGGYFGYTTAVGAYVHSDSWGTNDIRYDYLAQQVDRYSWENPEFLPVFPAGNEGQLMTSGQRLSGELTVTSPANSKNCLSVGATQTAGERMETTAVRYVVWDATVAEGQYSFDFRVMQANFGTSVATLGSQQLPLAVASPIDGCSPLQNTASLAGAVVLIQRGTCYFSEKALAAQDADAAAVLLFDNVLGAYFVAVDETATPISIPVMAVTRRLGQQLTSTLGAGKALTIAFAASSPPTNSFENLATYSSQGPTVDFRVKPDIVAPGTVTSARVGAGSANDCGLTTMAGTSMATPVTAGSALLVRQYFTDGFYPSGVANPADAFTPSGALLKAVLLGGAASIAGFEADTGLPIDPPPSFRQGFGRVQLANSLYLADSPGSRPLQVVDAVPISQGESHSYCIRAGGGPLAITLVWADYPASPAAERALVHDLDLTVRAAGLNGIPLLGNGGSVTDPSTPDRENNVEQVELDAVPAGLVSITVEGFNVPDAAGSPSYALVVTGDFNGTLTKPGAGGAVPQCTILVAAITSGPSGVTADSPVRFEFSTESGSSGVNFQCRLADGSGNVTSDAQHDWRDCTSPALYASLPDGAYQFAVRADGEEIASSRNFVLDTTPPQLAFLPDSLASGTATPAATANISWEGSDATGVAYTCTLQGSGTVPLQPPVYSGTTKLEMQQLTLGEPFNCTSPQLLHWLLPASWSLSVVAADPAGNQAPPQATTWDVVFDDGAGRYTRFLSGPFGLQPKANLTFSFADLEASGQAAQAFTQHECWLEALPGDSTPAYAACSSPFSLPDDVQDGAYRFHARITGSSGAGSTEAVALFELDSQPPTVSITQAPESLLSANATSASFNSSEEGTTFYCGLARVDGGPAPIAPNASAYAPCTSPAAIANLTDGNYAFGVYGVDAVGNQGSPVTASFLVDNTPPSFDSLSVPEATSRPEITATFSASDSGSGVSNVTCRFRALSLVDGSSAAGSSNSSGGGEEADWELCTSPRTYSGLKEGRYGLTLRASDRGGLTTQTDELSVFVDFTPPRVSTAGLPPLGQAQPSRVSFNLAESSQLPTGSYSGIATYQTLVESLPDEAAYSQLQLAAQGGDIPSAVAATGAGGRRRLLAQGETVLPASAVGSWTNCSAACTYEGLASGYYSLQVRAVDEAGNVGNTTDPYPFEVNASIGSTPFPTWAIIAASVGGALVLLALAILTWRCCCRRRRGGAPVRASHSPSPSSQYTYSPGSTARPTPSYGYPTGAYTAPTSAGGAGAWGYGAANGHHANGYANGRANGYSNGHAGNGYANGHSFSTPAPAAAPVFTPGMDPVEAQRLALAAASARRQARGGPHPQLSAAEEERQLRLAIDASLQEQRAASRRQAEEAQLRAAIDASLREQQSQRRGSSAKSESWKL